MSATTTINIDKYKNENVTMEELEDEFCKTPSILSYWPRSIAPNDIKASLISDRLLKGDNTLSVTKDMKDKFPGAGRHGYRRRSEPYSHHMTLTIVEDEMELSALAVCSSTGSFGPDYLNLKEGLFCRMDDRTLLTVCKSVPDPDAEDEDECFDVESQQVVNQQQLQRLRRRNGRKVVRSSRYDGEWRSRGSGWEHVRY